ncbi:MAG: Heat-inducible transcription repressor HrcA, partial [Actinomycetia bacterium]|nr:Heat-inducible transcription repressor HrcA [Actinomycetes bacterium]
SELDERKAAILRAIVEEFVTTAQPVGSQTIAKTRELGVSSATVRNEMTMLERDGYIVQPHTSAGRVPTDLGYRFFVDHFIRPGALPPAQRRTVADFFGHAHTALEDLLHETSQLLVKLTDHASVVVGPQKDTVLVHSVQVVAVQPDVALVLVVLSNGDVEKQTVRWTAPEGSDDRSVQARAANLLTDVLSGRPLAQLTADTALPASGDRVVDDLATLALAKLAETDRAAGLYPLYVGGASRVAKDQESFATTETATRLLELLEHQVVVVALVRDLLDQGLTISIGSENDLEALRDCSIVLAPYEVDGLTQGTIGVLGPTRMDYRRALAAVAAVSEQLNRRLSP